MRILKFLFFLLVLAGLAGAGIVGLAVWYFDRDLPPFEQLADYQPPIVTRVYAGDGRLMAEYAIEKRVFVPVNAMPPLLIHAFLAAEDRNFYAHPGIDPVSMLRAARDRSAAFAHRQAARRRLDHHAAGGEEFPAQQRGLARAQDQGSAHRHQDGAGAEQGPHSRALSQRDLSRQRRLRRGGGGAQLLQQVARRADGRRGRLSRGLAEGAQQL